MGDAGGTPWPTFAQVCICVAEAGSASLFPCTKAHGKERCCLLQSALFSVPHCDLARAERAAQV